MKASVFAIVPAAGRSRRMGTDKQLLDFGGRPMVMAVLDSLAAGGVHGVALVTRREIAATLPGLPASVYVVFNDYPAAEMIDSIRLGVRAWQQRETIAPTDGFLVCPADQPGIATADVAACIDAFRAAPERIVIAEHVGKRGHPIIFPAGLADAVLSPACDGGLNALPRTHASLVQTVACGSPGVTGDIDTPDDYTGGGQQAGTGY